MDSLCQQILSFPSLMEVVREILGEQDVSVVNASLVISMSGSEDQAWHADGPHCSVTEHLPAHCLNVFVPLVDVGIGK